MSLRERARSCKTLICLLQALRGQVTTVELRNECSITGKVENVDGLGQLRQSVPSQMLSLGTDCLNCPRLKDEQMLLKLIPQDITRQKFCKRIPIFKEFGVLTSEILYNMSDKLHNTRDTDVSLLRAKCYAILDDSNNLLANKFDSFRKKTNSVFQMHNSLLTSYVEKANNYYKEIEKLQEQKQKLRLELCNKEEWCKKERKICEEVHEEIRKKLMEISILETEIDTEKKKDKELQKLEDAGKVVNEKAVELNKAFGYFQQKLALRVKQTDLEELLFTFTHIDCNAIDQEFEFGIKVIEDNYIVTRCEPAVPNMKQLLKTLNETNNLQNFVCALREAFKESCVNKN